MSVRCGGVWRASVSLPPPAPVEAVGMMLGQPQSVNAGGVGAGGRVTVTGRCFGCV